MSDGAEIDGNETDINEIDVNNEIDEAEIDEEVDGNRIQGAIASAVLEHVVRALVEDPDSVRIEVDDSGRRTALNVFVAPGDMGRVIGKRGRVAQSIRTVVRAAAARDGIEVDIEFVD